MNFFKAREATHLHYQECYLDLEIVKVSEVSQTEKGKYHMLLLIWGILKKKKIGYKRTYLQKGNRVTDIENNLWLPREKVGGDKLGDWDWHIYTTIIYKRNT